MTTIHGVNSVKFSNFVLKHMNCLVMTGFVEMCRCGLNKVWWFPYVSVRLGGSLLIK